MATAAAPHLTLDIAGMHCAGCAAAVERALERVAGAGAVTVSAALQRADIRAPVDPAAAVAAVEAAGYGASPRIGTAAERRAARERLELQRRRDERWTFGRFLLAAALLVPFLADMALAAVGRGHGALLPPLAQLALAVPAQFVAGWPFLRGAVRSLRAGAPNMDVLVSLGTLAAFGLSAWRVLGEAPHGEALYFEGAVAVIAFVLLGKVLEARARAGAGDAVAALVRGQQATALVHRDGSWIEAPAEAIALGELFAVRPGERAAADGVVADGASDMDESLVTGESLPQHKARGATVIAGALNGLGMLTVEATAVGEDATIARLARLVEQAETTRAPAQRLADRVSRLFVPAVLVVAALTFAVWWWLGARETAIVAAVSVLVVSCPCALGLATPIALVAGMGAAARSGILVRDHEALERASEVDTVAFDKTGTLTVGRPRVVAISAPGVGPDEALKLALALSLAGGHPLAAAVREAAEDRGVAAEPAAGLEVVPGGGVKGFINGVRAYFGSAEFVRGAGISLGVLEQAISRDASFGEAQSVSWLAGAGRVIGAFAFADAVRPHAEAAVRALAAEGVQVAMLSGDRRSAAEAAARELGIAEVHAGLKPDGKLRTLAAMTAEGRRVAMVGDGLNDAPALAAAPLGIAMGSGAEAAQAAAGVTLMRPDLRLVAAAVRAARETRAVIRQNLWLAFGFNGLGIPLAALGWLTPAVAGAAMAASSLAVVTNALRLRRRRFA